MKIILTTQRRKYVSNAGIFLITAVIITAMISFGGTCYRTSLPPSENLEIWTWYDLDAVRDNLRGNHTLMNDLDSSTDGYEELASPTANGGKGWEPIGFTIPQQYWTAFSGTFDGQGHEIRGLFIDRPDEICVGLFGVSGGFIKDTAVMNCTVTGDWVGGLLGWNEHGTVRNCYCSGKVTGDKRVGGLIGNNCGPVNNSYFTGSVTGNSGVGGLMGYNSDPVSRCYSTGSVIGNSPVGGLAGRNDGDVSNSYFNGNVSGQNVVGGLVGENGYKGNVSNSYSTGNVSGQNVVGGLVGSNAIYGFNGTVNNSFWDTETSGQATSAGGTGKNTTEMQDISTFSGADWDIIEVALNETNSAHIWNIVNNVTYPFLSWHSVKIRDWYDLDAIRNYLDHSYVLMNNLNSTTAGYTKLASPTANEGKGWEPIGTWMNPFTGTFDGQGYEIYDLYINRPDDTDVGLFGVTTRDAVIQNIGVITATVTGDVAVGCLVGGSYGTVSNSYSSGNVTGYEAVGGLVGWHAGTVSNSYSAGGVTGTSHVGGLVGMQAYLSTVSNSYSTSNVTGYSDVGGLVGWMGGTVSNSFWDTQTSGQNSSSGGTGKNTTEMKDITTFSGATWNIIAVANPSTRNTTYIWNIVNNVTYPFLSWEP